MNSNEYTKLERFAESLFGTRSIRFRCVNVMDGREPICCIEISFSSENLYTIRRNIPLTLWNQDVPMDVIKREIENMAATYKQSLLSPTQIVASDYDIVLDKNIKPKQEIKTRHSRPVRKMLFIPELIDK